MDHRKFGIEASTSVSTHSLSSAQVFPNIPFCECSWSGRRRGRRIPPARLIPCSPVSNPTQDSCSVLSKRSFQRENADWQGDHAHTHRRSHPNIQLHTGLHSHTWTYSHTHTQTHRMLRAAVPRGSGATDI